MPIFRIVSDCTIKNARWDYDIKVNKATNASFYTIIMLFLNLTKDKKHVMQLHF